MERKTYRNCVYHCYQNTPDGFLLFYDDADRLAFFTLLCTVSRQHPIRILKLCPMVDHIHLSVFAERPEDLSAFMQDYSSRFAVEHHRICHSSGPVFNRPFGSAPKWGDKKLRTHFIYLDNNPVERKLVLLAEQYRWNFLAYAVSSHPFSEKLVLRYARYPLRRAVQMVRQRHMEGKHLPYVMIRDLFSGLTDPEREQLIDFCISLYSVIDHSYCIRYFDSYERMLLSIHANTGSEFDINETFTGKTDAIYAQITGWLMASGRFQDIHDVLALDAERRMELLAWLIPRTGATPDEIARYLHFRLAKPAK